MIQGFKITEDGRDNNLVVIEKTKEGARTWKGVLFKGKVEVDRYTNIKEVKFFTEEEIKNKAISRGIVGGILLGPIQEQA